MMRYIFLSYLKLIIYVFALLALYLIWNDEAVDEVAVSGKEEDVATKEIKRVAITFDDGPHSIYTEQLLDGLKERNVVATFFVVGANIEENEEIIQRMNDEGHLIGNHTYSHTDICNLSVEQRNEEIYKTNERIKAITGETVGYIRPPFGNCKDKNVDEMLVIMWNVDPRDWCIMDADVVVENIVKDVEAGDIILLHDIFKSSVEAALKVIDILKEKGYEFVTVEELIF